MQVSKITKDDVSEVFSLALLAFEESYYREFTPNEAYIKNLILRSIPLYHVMAESDYFGIKAVSEGKIVGFFLGHKSDMGFCDLEIGMDDGFYVDKEYRGSRAISLMFEAFKDWCDAKNIRPSVLIHFGDNNDATYHLCKKLGFAERGKFFLGV